MLASHAFQDWHSQNWLDRLVGRMQPTTSPETSKCSPESLPSWGLELREAFWELPDVGPRECKIGQMGMGQNFPPPGTADSSPRVHLPWFHFGSFWVPMCDSQPNPCGDVATYGFSAFPEPMPSCTARSSCSTASQSTHREAHPRTQLNPKKA